MLKPFTAKKSADAPQGRADHIAPLERLALLSQEIKNWSTPQVESEGAEAQETRAPLLSTILSRRAAKSAVALVAAVVIGWIPLSRLLQTSSAEAVVNARLVTLRAPIAGEVTGLSLAQVGTTLESGTPLLAIHNTRTDRSRLDELLRAAESTRISMMVLEHKSTVYERQASAVERQRDEFQKSRVAQLEARMAEIEADIASADARKAVAAKALERSRQLTAAGFQSAKSFDQAEADFLVAERTVEATRKRLAATRIEWEGAKRGFFVGDSYNDVPRSAQRLEEINQEQATAEVELVGLKARAAALDADIKTERAHLELRSNANMATPARGRLWEVFVASGESVRESQDLARILDCSGVVVTAAVSEANYNSLHLGGRATFRLRGDSTEHEGRIIALNGLAAVPANLAIRPTALLREPYHVVVEVPGLASAAADCGIGRTGKVTFDTSRSAAPGR